MKCKCGYKTDSKRAFINHTRNGCKTKGRLISFITCPCGKKVKVLPSKHGRKKFCSIKCRNENYVRPLGIKPHYTIPNPGWFKKGEVSDGNHHNISRMPEGYKNYFQWANISSLYKRDLSDWKQLCIVCHRAFDKITKLTKEQANEVKLRKRSGEKFSTIAKYFNVNPQTISNIVNNRIKYYAD